MLVVGITHAPRDENLISWSIKSLFQELTPRAVWIFREPGATAQFYFSSLTTIVTNTVTRGCFANWFFGLQTLVDNYPDSPFYLMCEDDAEWKVDSGIKLTVLLNALREQNGVSRYFGNVGLISPYCSCVNCNRQGWELARMSRNGWCGALTTCLPNQVAKQLLGFPWTQDDYKGKHLDYKIGNAIHDLGYNIITHTPSLIRHLGHECSTLVPKGHLLNEMKQRYAYDPIDR